MDRLINIDMSYSKIKDAIKLGIDRNILFYDADADNKLSMRLIALAKSVTHCNHFGKILGIYISMPEKIELYSPHLMIEEVIIENVTTVLNIPFYVTSIDMEKIFKDLGGTNAPRKTKICLVICEYGYLIGGF